MCHSSLSSRFLPFIVTLVAVQSGVSFAPRIRHSSLPSAGTSRTTRKGDAPSSFSRTTILYETKTDSPFASIFSGSKEEDDEESLSEFSDASAVQTSQGFSYVEFAKEYPFVNNVGIATVKTAAADLLAQTVIGGTPLAEVDVQRSWLFCLFGALYLGSFQYFYQVQVFSKLFDVEKFTQQSWSKKLQDKEGLINLSLQTALDLAVLTVIYLPTFYIFKASVFSGSSDPSLWVSTGIDNYTTNFAKDEVDLIKVWLPADLICFSVPLYLRLPVRHVVSFVWTAYLSFARGGH